MKKGIGKLMLKRAVAPVDVVNLDITTVEAVDASKDIVCAAISGRVFKNNGMYLCQLIFLRSKLVSRNLYQPRLKLLAANTNAHTRKVARRSLVYKEKRKILYKEIYCIL